MRYFDTTCIALQRGSDNVNNYLSVDYSSINKKNIRLKSWLTVIERNFGTVICGTPQYSTALNVFNLVFKMITNFEKR